MEITQHARYTCTFCGKDSVKRTAVGIWKCKACKKVIAGGAWTVSTTAAATVRRCAHLISRLRNQFQSVLTHVLQHGPPFARADGGVSLLLHCHCPTSPYHVPVSLYMHISMHCYESHQRTPYPDCALDGSLPIRFLVFNLQPHSTTITRNIRLGNRLDSAINMQR